jgi:hypothetical protein
VYCLGVAVVVSAQALGIAAPWPRERAMSFIEGQLVGLLIISVVPSLLVFYVSGRSQKTASITFTIFVALGTVAQIGEAVRNGGRVRDDKAVLARITPAYLNWLKDQSAPYQRGCKEIAEESPLSPSWMKDKDDLARVRERILRVREANTELRGVYDRMPQVLQKELAAQGVPEEDRSRLIAAISADLAKTNTKTLFVKVCEQDDALLHKYLKACDVLDVNWGQWHFDADTGTVVFENATAAQDFNAIQAAIRRLALEQERTRGQLSQAMQQSGRE